MRLRVKTNKIIMNRGRGLYTHGLYSLGISRTGYHLVQLLSLWVITLAVQGFLKRSDVFCEDTVLQKIRRFPSYFPCCLHQAFITRAAGRCFTIRTWRCSGAPSTDTALPRFMSRRACATTSSG